MIIEAECKIPAPKAKCFEAFSDLLHLADKVNSIVEIDVLTSGEIGLGTKFKETRVMFGSKSSEVMEITIFEPDSHIREEARSGGVHYISDWMFTESNGDTSVTISFNIQAETFKGKLTSSIFFFLKSALKNAFLTDMNDMKKAICES